MVDSCPAVIPFAEASLWDGAVIESNGTACWRRQETASELECGIRVVRAELERMGHIPNTGKITSAGIEAGDPAQVKIGSLAVKPPWKHGNIANSVDIN